ncbi:MAG: GGDEF domain-containing protein [Gammaproteobacteria bacterium]|nr:hypothetical protein [Gammaproteobacteria bacterium]
MSSETSTVTAQPSTSRTLLGLHLIILLVGALHFAFVPSVITQPMVAAAALALSTVALFAVRVVPVLRSHSWRQHATEITVMIFAVMLLATASGGIHSPLVVLNLVPLAALAITFARWWWVLIGAAVLAALGWLLGAFTPGVDVKSPAFGISLLTALAPGALIAVIMASLAQDVQDASKRIRALATTDPLTGLFNARSFEQVLQHEHRAADRRGRSYSVIRVAVHEPDEIDETSDQQAILKAVASAITRSIRSTDVAARLTGDDFAVLCMDASADIGAAIAQRIRNNAHASTVSIGNRLVRLSVSVGVANYPADHLSPKRLLAIAAQRMQQDHARA